MAGEIFSEVFLDDGRFPNNEKLPVLLYRRAFQPREEEEEDPASVIESTFRRNGWGGTWRNGIYSYSHYHSTAHEVLGVARGSARVQLGGDSGGIFDVGPGDVLVLPAGVAHKNVQCTSDFLVVGAYPRGQEYDMNSGQSGERPRADENIARTPLPETDPVHGSAGPLLEEWNVRS